jgi:hypothetical protein
MQYAPVMNRTLILGLLICTLAPSCEESKQPPQPKNRRELEALEQQGYSFSPKERPAWVDSPPQQINPSEHGWTRVGRKRWFTGPRSSLSQLTEIGAFFKDSASFLGKRVRISANVRLCGELLLMEQGKNKIAVALPAKPPGTITGTAVVEGRVIAGNYGQIKDCAAARGAPVFINAQSVLVQVE